MEQIIIIGLLITIIVLLIEKKFSKGNDLDKTIKENVKSQSLLGTIKDEQRNSSPINDIQSQGQNRRENHNNFDPETKNNEADVTYLDKNSDQIFVNSGDWVEDDWRYEEELKIESGFATGVTFQELSAAGQMLQEKVLEPALEKEAVNIIQKIEGTELFNLLENSMEGASLKIARLLHRSNFENRAADPSRHNDDVKGFDIGEFV